MISAASLGRRDLEHIDVAELISTVQGLTYVSRSLTNRLKIGATIKAQSII